MTSTEIQPIEYLVFAGFQQRFEQVFGCAKCAFINANDKTKILQRLFGEGKPLTYPYAYFEIHSVGANTDSYNSHALGRRGLPVNIRTGQTVQTVRVMPVNFELEITYVTDRFQSVEQGSVLSFVNRWLMARRFGYLKSSVNYGRLQFGVNVTMAPDVSIPSRENITESEVSYVTTMSATIHGYISEPVLSEIGKVNQFNVNGQVSGVNGQIVSTQFFAFPEQGG
jgi:hypothetical protein